jgi:hypothetical protein
MSPKHASLVEDFNKNNKRYPTVDEAKKLFDNFDNQSRRDTDLNEQRLNRFLNKHADSLAKAGVPELIGAYNELADQFNTGKNVEGVGTAESYIPNLFIGPQAARNRTNMQQIANALLKQRSGAAVSDQEYRRFLLELQAGKIPSERAVKAHMGKIGLDLKGLVGTLESGLPKDALDEYAVRPGAITSSMVKEIKDAVPADKPTKAGWSIRRLP